MRMVRNIVSFGAGYQLGAATGAGPIRRLEHNRMRWARGGRPLRGVTSDMQIHEVMTAIRAIAEGRDPRSTTVEEIFSRDLVAASPTDTVWTLAEISSGAPDH